ncbi:hypothetical protein NDU88_000395, partial [Pleurodeles waltl]
TWQLKQFTNCASKNVMYCIQCPCSLFYIGKTPQVRKCIIQYQSRILSNVVIVPMVEHCNLMKDAPNDMHWFVL